MAGFEPGVAWLCWMKVFVTWEEVMLAEGLCSGGGGEGNAKHFVRILGDGGGGEA
jgi:hypothetical protein